MESYPFFLVFHQDFLQSHFLASLSVLCFEHLTVVGEKKPTENFYYSLVIAGGRYQCWTETLSLKVLHFGPRVFEFKATGVVPRDAAVAEPVTATTQNTRSSK